MGGETPQADAANRAPPRSPARAARSPAHLPPSVISALAAGISPSPPPSHTRSFPNSSLPPSRGEVRWGVRRRKPAPPIAPRPDLPRRSLSSTPAPSVIPALAAGISPSPPPSQHHLFPNSSLPPSRGEVRWGVRRREPTPPIVPRPDRPPAPIRHSCTLFFVNCLATVRIYRLTIEIIENKLGLASNPNNLVNHATHHHPALQV